jgi:monoamine oxidase
MPQCRRGDQTVNEPDAEVAVVGAGVAGLATARHLDVAGRSVVVLEARDRVGGRLDSVDGLDLGATWFWPNEPRVQQLIADLGVPTHEQHLAGDAVYHDRSGMQRLQGNPIDVRSGRFALGADSLTRAIAADLPAGTVRLSCEVTGLAWQQAGHIELTTSTGAVTARHAVLALPPALAVERLVFDPALPTGIVDLARQTPVWMGGVTKVVARYGDAFWRRAGLSGSGISHVGPMREVHDMSGVDGVPGALFGFVPARRLGDPTVTEAAVVEQLVTMFGPDAADIEALHIRDWRAERHTSPPGVEELTAFEHFGDPRFSSPLADGRLHWASTETAREFAGHIEGALVAAERTAHTIITAASTASTMETPA